MVLLWEEMFAYVAATAGVVAFAQLRRDVAYWQQEAEREWRAEMFARGS